MKCSALPKVKPDSSCLLESWGSRALMFLRMFLRSSACGRIGPSLPFYISDRRTSLPVMSRTRSSFSNMSDHPQDTSRHLGLQHYDEWLKAVLESMLDGSREEIRTMRLGLVPTVARAQRRRMQPSTRSCLYFTCNGRSLKRAAWLTARWTPGASSTSNLSRLSSRPRRDPGDITTGSRSYPALR